MEFSLFDDAAGDFEGLDSYSRKSKSKEVIGYQYKYFPSPLSDNHRAEIASSLTNATKRAKRLKLQKWVLVTPNDFTNSGRREGGGDVDWFESLREKFKEKFEIEHIGHSKLVSLFMQAPHLSLFYYPELVVDGMTRRKTIQEIRTLYNQQMKNRYGRIEFVGMSVYKDETSRRVPLENIYIPLSVLPERSPEEVDDTPRVDPVTLLAPGARSIILGDPGSGKSTLLAFLALVGIAESLQTRCGKVNDNRLTIVVTLRRYADELKSNANLSLLEYVLDVARADFSIPALDISFYEFYLESGQAVILFDGLDELPGTRYKSVVRKRIESFSTSYPGNTIIVSSRLVGYEAEIRFDETYGHYRVAKLRPAEIEKFILDWYAARIEDDVESKRNAADLIRVIKHTDSESIRDLARNPLLLTIVTLVHRIDAVLPDQRVILYQKCTETLLNTWYKAKRRDEEAVKGRVERRNRLRIEAIAYWMQKRSLGAQGRSVVSHNDLLAFLTDYINERERPKETDDPAEDQAEIFLGFIKNAAGLLIEAGDGLYSFIHLTFQEYLCATHLSAFGEVKGAQSIWDELGGELQHPRWREVVRLLVASLKSIQGQSFFVQKLVDGNKKHLSRDAVLLLIGLLKDAIEPAEEFSADILLQAFECLLTCNESNDVRAIEGALRAWIDKNVENKALAVQIHDEFYESVSVRRRLDAVLIRAGMELPQLSDEQKLKISESGRGANSSIALLKGIIFDPPIPSLNPEFAEALFVASMVLAFESPDTNLAGVMLFSMSLILKPETAARRLFDREFGVLASGAAGPHRDNGRNIVSIALPFLDNINPTIYRALRNSFVPGRPRTPKQEIQQNEEGGRIFEAAFFSRLYSKSVKHARSDSEAAGVRRAFVWTRRADMMKIPNTWRKATSEARKKIDRSELPIIRSAFREKMDSSPDVFWRMVCASDVFSVYLMEAVFACAGLKSNVLWSEALRASLVAKVPLTFARYLQLEEWTRLEKVVHTGEASEQDLDLVAWLLTFDIWIWNNRGYDRPEHSPFDMLSKNASFVNYAPIQLALAARDVAYRTAGAEDRFLAHMAERGTPISDALVAAGWLDTIPPRSPGRVRKKSA
ncbi:NACHT domain-containing protein [Paraburkholderia fynbosensis]|nr:NACHT domain-containing protein [Paraburkholderia fynbosensis]